MMNIESSIENNNHRMRKLKVDVDFDTTMALSPQSLYSMAPSPIQRLWTGSTMTTTAISSLAPSPLNEKQSLDDTRKSLFLYEISMEKYSIVIGKGENSTCTMNRHKEAHDVR
jgi:hypothetical protein